MNNIIEDYIRKILEIGCNIKENENLIIYSNEEKPEFDEIILKIKDEYKINKIIFVRNDYEKIYNFSKQEPTKEEIEKFINKYPKIEEKNKVKIISFYPNGYNDYYHIQGGGRP